MITEKDVEEVLGQPFSETAGRCHEVSLALVKAGVVEGRVARGTCAGVVSQHSWIVLGDDCYAEDARICDPTLWFYRDDVDSVWYGTAQKGWHHPHGVGFIWDYGRPGAPTGKIIELAPSKPLTWVAENFLRMLGPLDLGGWHSLANSPVQGWPAAEVIEAMYDTPGLGALVPIDVVGMLTNRNPGGLYLPSRKEEDDEER